MGLAGYYKIFVQDFSQVVHPITPLQQKGKKFVWSDRCERPFRILKKCLMTLPILVGLDPQGEFFIYTDASLEGIGGVLIQEGRVVSFEYCKLKYNELNYPTHDLELATVFHVLVKWRNFLLGWRFTLKTDHLSLCHLLLQPNLNAHQQCWMELLCQYDMGIEHVKRKENVVVDALSRQRHVVMSTLVGTNLQSRILQQLHHDNFYIIARAEIEFQRPIEGNFNGFSLQEDGLLQHRGQIYVPRDGEFRQDILIEAHREPYLAHPRVKKMHATLRHLYNLRGLQRYVAQFVLCCLE